MNGHAICFQHFPTIHGTVSIGALGKRVEVLKNVVTYLPHKLRLLNIYRFPIRRGMALSRIVTVAQDAST